jgi:hypothetical protein
MLTSSSSRRESSSDQPPSAQETSYTYGQVSSFFLVDQSCSHRFQVGGRHVLIYKSHCVRGSVVKFLHVFGPGVEVGWSGSDPVFMVFGWE